MDLIIIITAALITIAIGTLFLIWDKRQSHIYRTDLVQCNKEKTTLYNQVCKQKRQIKYLITESSNVTSKSKKVQSENYRLRLSNTDCKKNLNYIRKTHRNMLTNINKRVNHGN